METEKILVSESLQETLWRLEEVRQGFRSKSTADVREALEWVLSRQGLQGSYCNLFLPTSQDLSQGVRLLTGERLSSSAATRHVLGEEALRTAIVHRMGGSSAVKQALKGFNQILDRGARSGSYCCYNCTVAFLRALTVVKPNEWNQILEKGVNAIRKARTADGKWHGFPFYYTLLTLSEMETPSARAELKYASRMAERLVERYQSNNRISRFRKLALEATLNSV